MRCGSEVGPLQWSDRHSRVEIVGLERELPIANVTLNRRKSCEQPVVLTRSCICKLQGRTSAASVCFAAVCIIRAAFSGALPMPDGLAFAQDSGR
jgi:hypothetical protein